MRFWHSLLQAVRQLAASHRLLRHALLLAILCLLLQGYQPHLIYQSERLWLEPWRLWTAHLVHVGWMHAVLNLTALLLLPWIFPHYPVRRFWLILLVGSPLLSLWLSLALPDLLRYAGLSGILHGIYFSAAIHAWMTRSDRLVAWVLCLGITIKLISEQLTLGQTSAALIGAPVLTQAHYMGVAVVLGLSAVFGHLTTHNLRRSINLSK